MTEVTELIKEYEQQATVKELAQRFGVHRLTVSALLKRHGIELRQVGLNRRTGGRCMPPLSLRLVAGAVRREVRG
jgi:excisionase family DNA binding protein